MPPIRSQISTTEQDYLDRQNAYSLLAKDLAAVMANTPTRFLPESGVQTTDPEKAKKQSTTKLSVAERIARLSDPGTPILEIAPLGGLNIDGNTIPGAGIATCIATVARRPCVIVANDPAAKGGTYFPSTVKKHLRAQQIAEENKLPCIYLVDSGGAFLPLQDQVFPDRFHFGRIFFNQARMSAMGIPQLSLVLGSCTAGGAYVPAMSDEAAMVRGNATIFLGGPPLVKAATGEEVTAEELGGAQVHCTISGVADHLAESVPEALALGRILVANTGADLHPRLTPSEKSEEPLYDPFELYGIVGNDVKRPIPMREILARLLDGSRLDEFKATYGQTLICGFGHIHGFLVGIIANDGILFSESALKAAHFIELCNQRGIPLLFVQNIVGFMVGKTHEHNGIAKHGAKMVSAVATSRVPKFTLIVGGSYGAGNYGMCGRAYDPRFLFTWPNSRTAVMGGNQAAGVLSEVKSAAAARKGSPISENDLKQYHSSIVEQYEEQSHPYFSSARLWDDGVIDPLDTRATLALAFASTYFDPNSPYNPGIFRM